MATIKKIEIETAEGETVELSLEEAKELYSELEELFGRPCAPYVPYPYTPSPWFGEPLIGREDTGDLPGRFAPGITCGDTNVTRTQ